MKISRCQAFQDATQYQIPDNMRREHGGNCDGGKGLCKCVPSIVCRAAECLQTLAHVFCNRPTVAQEPGASTSDQGRRFHRFDGEAMNTACHNGMDSPPDVPAWFPRCARGEVDRGPPPVLLMLFRWGPVVMLPRPLGCMDHKD